MRPSGGRCRCVAIISAARGSSVRIWSRIDQPTILRVARSSTAARYSHPSPVAMKGMSASQMRFGADATNSCFKRFRCDRQIVAAVGRARPEPATGERADTVASHQTRDAATACRPALRTERGMYPGAAVTAMMLAMETTHIGKQRTVGARPGAFWTVAPCVIAAGRDLKNPAHQPDRPLAGMVADELELISAPPRRCRSLFLAHRAPYARGRAHVSAA